MRVRVYRELRRYRNNPQHIVARNLGYTVTCADLRTVVGTNWLNDVVIDLYLSLVAQQAVPSSGERSLVHVFTTHFYNVLHNRGYEAVRRWTESVDLFSFDLVLVPIHDSDHWSLVALRMAEQSFEFYDSMGRRNVPCFRTLMKYLREEHMDKRRKPLHPDDMWECHFVTGIPIQTNTNDCGVFVCLYAECLVRKSPFSFSARDIKRLRCRIAFEILQGALQQSLQ